MAQDRLTEAIRNVQKIMDEDGVDPRLGLPEPLFLFATTLMPVANIDLFVVNDTGSLLLTWRDDRYFGRGWHIPGGCVRMRETLDERIHKTAITELGGDVSYDPAPIVVRESMAHGRRPWLENELERSHNLSFLYQCRLPETFQIDNRDLREHDPGFAKWFDAVPADLLPVHRELYGDVLEKWFERKKTR